MNSASLRTGIFALTTLLAAAPVFAKDKAEKTDKADNPVIATVNGTKILKSRADAIAAVQAAQGHPDSEDMRKEIREFLIRSEVLAQEARKKGLDKSPEVKGQIELATMGALSNAYLSDYVRHHPIAEDAAKKEYENIRSHLGNKEYKAKHILVDKEDDAKAIIEKLKKGEKFEELAKQSKDPGSKDNGGDLAWAAPSSYVKPFAEALTKLEKGKYTETPVKSDFGYHVILLEDSRDLKVPSFDEVKPQVEKKLVDELVQKHLSELRIKAKVE